MKRYLKYSLLIMVMLFSLVMGGCQQRYNIYIEYEYASIFMEDKMIDILVPERKLNPAYMEFNSHNGLVSEESEIVRYKDENGYSSMFFHTNLIQEYSFLQKKAILTLNSKNSFYNMCDDFGTFRIVVFDKDGKIHNISEEIPFKSSERYYLDNNIAYNPETNTVSPLYENIDGFNPWSLVSLIFAWIEPFFSIVMFLVLFLPKDVSLAKSPWTLFIFGVMLIPLVVYLFFRYDDAVKSSISDKMAVEVFFDFGVSWICIPYLLLPYIAFIGAAFMIYYRRKKDEAIRNDIPMIYMK